MKLTIYFATMTGNAEDLAEKASATCKGAGHEVDLRNLADSTVSALAQSRHSLFIASTWGDGEPPDDAEDFYEELEASNEDLSNLSYAVFGLGDTSYPEFNAFARNLDETLQGKGATTFLDRVEADVFFDDTYEEWINQVLKTLSKLEDQVPA